MYSVVANVAVADVGESTGDSVGDWLGFVFFSHTPDINESYAVLLSVMHIRQ